jgi:chemotaxis response regulator CheB
VIYQRAGQKDKFLTVDDNSRIRQALCELFQRESDFQVCREAENGKGTIAKALELYPDLIVLDLSMPVMNGLNAARELKRLMPVVPIIMFTPRVGNSNAIPPESRSNGLNYWLHRCPALRGLGAKSGR